MCALTESTEIVLWQKAVAEMKLAMAMVIIFFMEEWCDFEESKLGGNKEGEMEFVMKGISTVNEQIMRVFIIISTI